MTYTKQTWTDNVTSADKAHMDTIEQGIYDAGSKVDIRTANGLYTLVLADQGMMVECLSATAVNVTIPLNSSVAFPIGTIIDVCQIGAGQVTINPVSAGVTLQSRGAALKTAGQYAVCTLRKRNTDTWLVTGDLTT